MTKLLFLAGSTRTDSLNKKLAQYACRTARQSTYVKEAKFIDLRDYEMPIYDGDLEAESGLPENAIKLKQLFAESDGIFISSPEYNGGFSGVLKNSIDWISRPHEKDEPPLIAFAEKNAAICAASPGGLGGLRGLIMLRMQLAHIGMNVVGKQHAVGGATDVFDAEGNISSDFHQKNMNQVVEALVKACR